MAVESRFVVIRNGVEAKTFMDKKSADEYDKMLDMADNLSQMFSQSSVELSDSANEELSIFLAQHREEVLVALLAKKPAKVADKKSTDKGELMPVIEGDDKSSAKSTSDKGPVPKAKKSKVKATTVKLS
ncbi:YebG family protein [Colwellia psychrerythraea]|uniref:YebG family protein n=1 Tax=Colwellia psychrerythraea TaxID=28229 RepID=A0A099KL77_COLPS|nr:YebG family protein [Colwellia psychrerythraea]KGJ90687.1 YebG family protein [Colwellia psychrerythraea]